MDDNICQLIFQTIDQTISREDFERLQDAIEQNDQVRAEYLSAVNLCESLAEIAVESREADGGRLAEAAVTRGNTTSGGIQSRAWRLSASQAAIAATMLLVVGSSAFWLGQRRFSRQATQTQTEPESAAPVESLIAGHATLRRSVDLVWSAGAASYREGDVLPDGLLQFDDGVAEIDFFCGATMIVEGPAQLDIESDWSVRVLNGRLRASVPPAARGFVVKAADSEIVDLGTEFALEVDTDNARLEVIDGEVKLRGGQHDGDHLITGQRQWLKTTQTQPEAFTQLSTVDDLRRRREDAEAQRLAQWQRHSQSLSKDERLAVYYPIGNTQSDRIVRNAASSGSIRDGQLVGPVNRTTGRFGSASAGFEFDRPGSRVRTRIDGEFQAFTFACWVRIDSLEHVYNALFMSDGYENGEPHWQIRDDGRLMFSVMVDDSQEVRVTNRFDQRVVQDAGLHRVYYTEPFWDISKSGQWFHIAAVYDPRGRRVVQYVNGEQVSREAIIDEFHITALRIGPAEVGNWGQPFRKTPWFAVRNLNGTIDELAIFNASLSPADIQTLYQQGKPLGY